MAVDLPDAGAETGAGSFFDEACHVLCRIAKKEADLMRKFSFLLKASHQAVDALAFVFRDISSAFQDPSGFFVCQITGEAGRSVEIDQGPVFGKPQGDDPESLGHQEEVEALQLPEELSAVCVFRTEHGPCLQARQSGGTGLYDHLIGHGRYLDVKIRKMISYN